MGAGLPTTTPPWENEHPVGADTPNILPAEGQDSAQNGSKLIWL